MDIEQFQNLIRDDKKANIGIIIMVQPENKERKVCIE